MTLQNMYKSLWVSASYPNTVQNTPVNGRAEHWAGFLIMNIVLVVSEVSHLHWYEDFFILIQTSVYIL